MAYKPNGRGLIGNFSHDNLARALGWFSIGLGVIELLAPRKLGRAAGCGEQGALMRFLGLREVATGVGILTRRNPSGWLKARVGGDAMDLALLGTVLAAGPNRGRVALTAATVAGVTALDFLCSREFSHNPGANISAIRVTKSLIVNRPPEELFQFWRNFENLPRFMNHLESVTVTGPNRSHWIAKGPAGTRVEWDAEIVNEHPNEMIAWRSVEGADVDNAGSVRFAPATGGRGTAMKIELKYEPPAGVLGATVAKFFGQSPTKQIAVDLLRFKQLMETGEVARTDGQSSGRKRSTSRKFDDFVQTGI